MIFDMINESEAIFLFALSLCAIEAAILLLLLFAGVAVQRAWRWLSRHSWRDVVLFVGTKALKR